MLYCMLRTYGCASIATISASVLAMSIAFDAPSVRAQSMSPDAVASAKYLSSKISELEAIEAQIKGGTTLEDVNDQIDQWQDGYQTTSGISATGFVLNHCKNGLLGGLGGLIATGELAVFTPAGAATAALSSYVDIVVNTAGQAMDMTNIVQNTAFWDFLLDHVEYGKGNEIDDDTASFMKRNKEFLEDVAGGDPMPDPSTPGAVYWLRKHAYAFMFVFGRVAERNSRKFPRTKIDVRGRYGHGRYDVGYYRKLLLGEIAADLARLRAQLSGLVSSMSGGSGGGGTKCK